MYIEFYITIFAGTTELHQKTPTDDLQGTGTSVSEWIQPWSIGDSSVHRGGQYSDHRLQPIDACGIIFSTDSTRSQSGSETPHAYQQYGRCDAQDSQTEGQQESAFDHTWRGKRKGKTPIEIREKHDGFQLVTYTGR